MTDLAGSCHCGAVRFTLKSHTPYPFNLCYCGICRKTQGGGGFAVNIMGEAGSLEVEGEENMTVYRAVIEREGKREESPARRHFCSRCGSGLWAWDPEWPDWVYPFASAIDTPLPTPPNRTHIMLDHKAPWVEVVGGTDDQRFEEYPNEGIADWHRRLGLWAN
ncbi:MAG: GFA family protein [Alphaproteobacteria bacterium]